MNQIKAFSKYIISFFKKDWTIYDYPLRFKIQENVNEEYKWCIQVINWWTLTGLGSTKSVALEKLEKYFEIQVKAKGYKPRPGVNVPIEFVKTESVGRNYELLEDFIERILGFSKGDPVFISDETSLLDFSADDSLEKYYRKIEEVYGKDVREIKDANISKILDEIG